MLAGTRIHDEHKGVVILNLLHGTLSCQGELDHLERVSLLVRWTLQRYNGHATSGSPRQIELQAGLIFRVLPGFAPFFTLAAAAAAFPVPS